MNGSMDQWMNGNRAMGTLYSYSVVTLHKYRAEQIRHGEAGSQMRNPDGRRYPITFNTYDIYNIL